jgi:hypothetical protein
MRNILSILFLGLFSGSAMAAQVGTVIVDQASVYEYPQTGSNPISSLSIDDTVAVSNIPTEGFYKVRLPNGELGWISGNDIYVGEKGSSAPRRKKKAKSSDALPTSDSLDQLREGDDENPRPKKRRKKSVEEDADGKNFEEGDEFAGDHSRILLMLGAQYPAYAGFKEYYITQGITPGYGGVLEFQFQMSKHWHWATRAEFNFASVGSKDIGNSTTQTLKQSSIPLQLGLNWSPVTSKGFRFGFGVYGGMVVSSTITVAQTVGTTTQQAEYSSVNPTGLGVVQMSFGLGSHVAIILEGGYRYEKTGTLSASTLFGGIPALQIDYSGPVGHLGFEFKF